MTIVYEYNIFKCYRFFSLYLNKDKFLQLTTASGSEFETFTDLLLNFLSLLLTLKRLILKLWPRVLEIIKKSWTSRSINSWNILMNIIKSALNRRHSELSIFKSLIWRRRYTFWDANSRHAFQASEEWRCKLI